MKTFLIILIFNITLIYISPVKVTVDNNIQLKVPRYVTFLTNHGYCIDAVIENGVATSYSLYRK